MNSVDARPPTRRARWLRVGGALLVLLLAALLYGLHAAQQSHAGSDADVIVTLLAEPNVGVVPGSIITYRVQVRNVNDSEAARVLLHMPYNPQHVQVLDATFERSEDWVTAVGHDYLAMSFGTLHGGEQRSAAVRMLVNAGLPQGTVINMWAGYGWDDGDGGAEGRSANAVPLVVEAQPISSGAVWMNVSPPMGAAGTVYGFYTDRFAPGEPLHTTLYAPYGTQAAGLDTVADELGRAWFTLPSTGLPPGSYQLEVRGARTNLVAVATFTIQ